MVGQIGSFPLDNLVLNEWQKRTGVKIQWQPQTTVGLNDKSKVMLATGNVPDIFTSTKAAIPQVGPQSTLALDDLIKTQMPNYSKLLDQNKDATPAVRSPNGKLYGVFGRLNYTYLGWMYRKDLADKLGVAKLETLDDWYNFMKAVKTDNPKSYGAGKYGSVLNVADDLRGAFGIQGQLLDGWFTMRENKLVDGAILPEAKDVIATVRKWYTEGLMDPDMLKLVEGQKNIENLVSGKTVVEVDDYLNRLEDAQAQGQKQNPKFQLVAAPPPKGPNGDQAKLRNFNGWSYWGSGLGAKCKDPAAGAKFLDYLISDEGTTLYYLGIEGQTFEKKGDAYQFTASAQQQMQDAVKKNIDQVDNLERALTYLWGVEWPFLIPATNPAPGKEWDAYVGVAVTKPRSDAMAMEAQYLDKVINPPVFSEQEAGDLATLNADISTYREETWTKLIAGQTGMDQWDAYVAQMKKLGATKVEEIYNTAYHRTYNS
jgi:putative aldouronate transport system substrate-binding protein